MKSYHDKLEEMIDAVIKLAWNYTTFCVLFEKRNDYCQVREAHRGFFLTMYDSLLCSFFVTADLIFHEDKKGKATSLCNLIREIGTSNPNLAKKLNDRIRSKRSLIEKIGVLRNQVCAHRWEAKTPQEVFKEADVQLNMLKEVVDLARLVICNLAGDAGGNRKEHLEQQQLSDSTLQCVANDARQVMGAFIKSVH